MTQPSPASEPSDGPTASFEAEREQAFKVLTEAVTHLLQAAGRPPTGSEVRLEMKRRTYNGFQPSRVGYKRFRDFLSSAEERGLVQVDQERAGDVAVTISGVPHVPVTAPPLRLDIWKAFTDWNPGIARYYDISQQRAVMLPRDPAPLEPERFSELRTRVSAQPSEFIEIHPVSRQTQLDWMAEYSQSVPDLEVRELLRESLRGSKPAKVFVTVLRTVPGQLAGWHSLLRERVYAEVMKWRESDPRLEATSLMKSEASASAVARPVEPLPGPEISDKERRGAASSLAAGRLGMDRRTAQILFSLGPTPAQTQPSSLLGLRHALHRAIDRMPESELRKISIPVGYLFEE